jgi:hypothetical protein
MNAINITLRLFQIPFNIITVTYKIRTCPDVICILGQQFLAFRMIVLPSSSKQIWPRNVDDCENTVYLFVARGYYV